MPSMLTKKRSDNINMEQPGHPKGQKLSLDVATTTSNSNTTPSSSAESSLTPSPTTPTGLDQTIPETTPRKLGGSGLGGSDKPTLVTVVKSPPGILIPRATRSLSLPSSQRSSTSSVDIPPTSISTSVSPVESMDSSTTSLNLTVKVKFAPLPELAPRKRKSSTPLGIAARGQMMRRRRQQFADNNGYGGDPNPNGNSPHSGTPMWTTAEVESHRRRQQGLADPNEEDMEDPFVAFGKFVKGAWRKVANKENNKENGKAKSNPGSEEPRASESAADSQKDSTEQVDNHANGVISPALATIVPPNESPRSEDAEKRVREESVERRHTETIRSEDGRAYPWSHDADMQPMAV